MLPLIIVLLISFFIFVKISKMVSKTVAVLIDFILLGVFTSYSLHEIITVKIASGKAVYFWDALFFIVPCVLYYIALKYLVIYFPRVSRIFNFIISWIGTLLVYTILCSIFIGDSFPKLLNNDFFSGFTNYIIVSILAIVTFNIRKNVFANGKIVE
ncbi:hypothetical protein ACOMCU_25085 [Lysinibacillus sp. UGB7]|uniref:hypothetical protein n=1 Tax=Lysinibacillus sp. UGB7 TaxID=3411039 RepID=UPI003B81E0D8